MLKKIKLSSYTSGLFSSMYMFTFKVSFVCYKLFGIAPFTIVTSRGLRRNNKVLYILSFRCSPLSTIYNVLLLIVSSIYNSSFMYYISGIDGLYDSEMVHVIEVSLGVGSILVSAIIWAYFTYYRQTMVDIANHLVDIDMILTRNSYPYVKKHQMNIFLIILLNISLCIILVTTELIVYDLQFGRLFIYVFPVFIVSLTLIQYASVLNLVKQRFEYLNNALENIIKFNRLRSAIAFSPCEPVVEKIIGLRKVHSELWQLCQQIADFYSIPALFAITLMSGFIIYSGYDIVLPIVLPLHYQISIITLSDGSWLLMEIIPTIVMALTINSTIAEMRKMSNIIHTTLNQDACDYSTRYQLKAFSMEMVRKKINFTAYHCFPLDSTILQSMLSMTITYLIILLQLKARTSSTPGHIHYHQR